MEMIEKENESEETVLCSSLMPFSYSYILMLSLVSAFVITTTPVNTLSLFISFTRTYKTQNQKHSGKM